MHAEEASPLGVGSGVGSGSGSVGVGISISIGVEAERLGFDGEGAAHEVQPGEEEQQLDGEREKQTPHGHMLPQRQLRGEDDDGTQAATEQGRRDVGQFLLQPDGVKAERQRNRANQHARKVEARLAHVGEHEESHRRRRIGPADASPQCNHEEDPAQAVEP